MRVSAGSFWINLEDFQQRFDAVHVCHAIDHKREGDASVTGEWVSKVNAGGLNSTTFPYNPIFAIDVHATPVVITLTLPYLDERRPPSSTLSVFHSMDVLTPSKAIATTSSADREHSLVLNHLSSKSKGPLTVVPTALYPGVESRFTLRVTAPGSAGIYQKFQQPPDIAYIQNSMAAFTVPNRGTCGVCGKAVEEGGGVCLGELDWHRECASCTMCGKPVAQGQGRVVRNGEVWRFHCNACILASWKGDCVFCGDAIATGMPKFSGTVEVVSRGNVHAECLAPYTKVHTPTCAHCQEVIEPMPGRFSGESTMATEGDVTVVVHVECRDRSASATAPSCTVCGLAVLPVNSAEAVARLHNHCSPSGKWCVGSYHHNHTTYPHCPRDISIFAHHHTHHHSLTIKHAHRETHTRECARQTLFGGRASLHTHTHTHTHTHAHTHTHTHTIHTHTHTHTQYTPFTHTLSPPLQMFFPLSF